MYDRGQSEAAKTWFQQILHMCVTRKLLDVSIFCLRILPVTFNCGVFVSFSCHPFPRFGCVQIVLFVKRVTGPDTSTAATAVKAATEYPPPVSSEEENSCEVVRRFRLQTSDFPAISRTHGLLLRRRSWMMERLAESHCS